ncbi:methyltransferase domain-containing protein [Candidatus Berkiella aquae]|uniref:Class I SAM-dependent methyltransferase n=1 Tax=Candidatus Berkiella aquae TaxID=295108 RepID=A0A0Q9YLS2_9GAMM|nr:class I SAM-dependent methyltransferase [Candidatus Berkiella aquae]MCS5711572.1 class I SAM-dependent methyltransferase [Candidatus Berkiella aquae]
MAFIHKLTTTLLAIIVSFLLLTTHSYAQSNPPPKNKYWEAYFKAKLRDPPTGFIVDGLNAIQQNSPNKIALDLGCGVGHETLQLLQRGYQVVAVDSQAEAFEYMKQQPNILQYQGNLRTIVSTFEKLPFSELPQVDLVIASFALPFMKTQDFNPTWQKIVEKIKPGGYFIGNFFAPDFSFFAEKFRSHMTFHSKAEAMALLNGFEIVGFQEVNVPGTKPGTMNHYYVFMGKKR